MSSQSILATATPKTDTIDMSLPVSEIVIDVRNYVGWGLRAEISSADATGILTVFGDFSSNYSTISQIESYTITGGLFDVDGTNYLKVDNNNLVTFGYFCLKYEATSGTGTITISGQGNLRG